MEPKSGNQAKREDLYAEGLCRDCEAPLLAEELEADARRYGVCRAVAVLRKAKRRDTARSPQEIALRRFRPSRGPPSRRLERRGCGWKKSPLPGREGGGGSCNSRALS